MPLHYLRNINLTTVIDTQWPLAMFFCSSVYMQMLTNAASTRRSYANDRGCGRVQVTMERAGRTWAELCKWSRLWACTGNNGASRQDMETLLKEMEIMTSLGRHDNVIQLIGCASSTDGEAAPTWTVSETRKYSTSQYNRIERCQLA